MVKDLDALAKYAFSGHGGIMGKHQQSWQHAKQVLAHFDKRIKAARNQFAVFVLKALVKAGGSI